MPELEKFVHSIAVNGNALYEDGLETIVVPPLETADNVVRRCLKEVMVAIDAPMIHEAWLKVDTIDLYYRPLFVFQFEKMDDHGNAIELKLEELDGLNKDNWTTLRCV